MLKIKAVRAVIAMIATMWLVACGQPTPTSVPTVQQTASTNQTPVITEVASTPYGDEGLQVSNEVFGTNDPLPACPLDLPWQPEIFYGVTQFHLVVSCPGAIGLEPVDPASSHVELSIVPPMTQQEVVEAMFAYAQTINLNGELVGVSINKRQNMSGGEFPTFQLIWKLQPDQKGAEFCLQVEDDTCPAWIQQHIKDNDFPDFKGMDEPEVRAALLSTCLTLGCKTSDLVFLDEFSSEFPALREAVLKEFAEPFQQEIPEGKILVIEGINPDGPDPARPLYIYTAGNKEVNLTLLGDRAPSFLVFYLLTDQFDINGCNANDVDDCTRRIETTLEEYFPDKVFDAQHVE